MKTAEDAQDAENRWIFTLGRLAVAKTQDF